RHRPPGGAKASGGRLTSRVARQAGPAHRADGFPSRFSCPVGTSARSMVTARTPSDVPGLCVHARSLPGIVGQTSDLPGRPGTEPPEEPLSSQLRPTDVKRLNRQWRRRTEGRLALLVESVTQPFNLGSILRTCATFGVDQLWLSGNSADPNDPKVGKTALGTAAKVAHTRVS